MAAPIFPCSPGVRPASNCCFSIGWTTLVLRVSFPSIRQRTARTIIGTYSCLGEAGQIYGFRASGRSSQIGVSGLIHPSYCSTRMFGLSSSQKATAGGSPSGRRQHSDGHEKRGRGPEAYDWEGDVPLKRPWSRTIIYEMHVRGFTAHPSSGLPESKRGTYAALVERIPYLRQLGITAVELLPVFQFDPQDAPRAEQTTGVIPRLHFFAAPGI